MIYVLNAVFSCSIVHFIIRQYQSKTLAFSNEAYKFILFVPAMCWLLLQEMQYYVGSDYPTYYSLFRTNNTGLYQKNYEYGFVFICDIIEKLNLPAQSGFFIIAFIDIFFFCLFITKFNFQRLDIFLLIYFCCATSFINQLNALRQYAAMNIFLLAFYYLYKKQVIKFLILILLACMFHRSAIILTLLYPLRILFNKDSKYLLIFEIFAGIIICIKGIDFIIIRIVQFTPYVHYLNSEYFLESNLASFLNTVTKLIYVPFYLRALKFYSQFNIQLYIRSNFFKIFWRR